MAAVTTALLAQQPSDPTELLAKARDLIVARSKRLPDYTCVQTVDRRHFKHLQVRYPPPSCAQITALDRDNPADLLLMATDRLRLQLKVSQDAEIGTWAGTSQFSSSSVFELISGAYGTGTLGTFFGDIFEDGGAIYKYSGQTTAGGIKLAAYGYQVPLGSSHYEVKTGSGWTATGFSGFFWIDADSLDLRLLQVVAKEMPPETNGCEAETTVEYAKVKVGTGEFLLPVRSSMRMVMADATEMESTAGYSAWREYHGEATIRFDGEPAGGEVPVAASASGPLPAGLSLSLALTSPIDTDTAAAGDVFVAKLRKPVRIAHEVVAAAGSAVEGRIVQMQHWMGTPRSFTICVLLSMEVDGRATPLYARLSREDESRGVHLPPFGQSPLAAALVFATDKSRHIVPAGYQTNWITVDPPAEERK
jgi:hypothetical protein